MFICTELILPATGSDSNIQCLKLSSTSSMGGRKFAEKSLENFQVMWAIRKYLEQVLLVRTEETGDVYNSLIHEIKFLPKPNLWRVYNKSSHFSLSNAFLASREISTSGVEEVDGWYVISKNCLILKKWKNVFNKPCLVRRYYKWQDCF